MSIHIVRAVVSAVERTGASRQRFLAGSHLDASQLERHEIWLTVSDYTRIVETALEVTNDPALGLHLGEQTSSVMFPLLAQLVEHAATFGEALDMIERYTGLLAQGFRPCVVRQGERVALRFPFLCGTQPVVRVMAELAMTGLLRLLHQYVGEAATTSVCVSFAYPMPARSDEYRRIFGGRERFAEPFTELQFPRDWLASTQLHSSPGFHAVLKSHADRQLALQKKRSHASQVEQLLAASDPRALPSMEAVARALGMGTRTLARKLRSEQVTFAELVAKRRRSAAEGLLELRALSVQEVAEAMGFADAAAFHKAFKRWTGLTPKQYATSVHS